jgi:hypothetical protein
MIYRFDDFIAMEKDGLFKLYIPRISNQNFVGDFESLEEIEEFLKELSHENVSD